MSKPARSQIVCLVMFNQKTGKTESRPSAKETSLLEDTKYTSFFPVLFFLVYFYHLFKIDRNLLYLCMYV